MPMPSTFPAPVTDPRGVEKADLDASEIERNLDEISRRAWFIGDDRRIAPGQRIEQAGLARIGRPEDDDLNTRP